MGISDKKIRIAITISKEHYHKLKLRFNKKLGQKDNTISEYINKLISEDMEISKEWNDFK